MARNMQIFLQTQKTSNQKDDTIQQQNEENAKRLYSREKKFSPTKSKPLLFSFLLKQTSTRTIRSRAAKRTENALRQLYGAIIPV
jgi:hypothetical protein